MHVKDVMTRAVATCQTFDKLRDAAGVLQREKICCLPVVSDDGSRRVLGSLTDRGVATAAGRERRPLAELLVRDAMTGSVLYRAVNGSLEAALAFMRTTWARRLPVVDRDGRLLGLLTLGDITLHVAGTRDPAARRCRSEICRVLAERTRPERYAVDALQRATAVDEIMTTDVVVCRSDETLGSVSRRMDRTRVTCVPVLEPGDGRRVVAMLSDRDICTAAIRRGRPLDALSVDVAMSPALRSCWPDDSPEAATAIMRAFGVRRLPVVDAAFQLLGLVALGDLARIFLAADANPGDAACEEIAETLAAILRVARGRRPEERDPGDLARHVAF